ncbi:hypothetical protein K439DRAFT_1165940 [Ramaria rubella]|nr:hypothetical protein K439DRAFT_1165940 [Ramaria rubella]
MTSSEFHLNSLSHLFIQLLHACSAAFFMLKGPYWFRFSKMPALPSQCSHFPLIPLLPPLSLQYPPIGQKTHFLHAPKAWRNPVPLSPVATATSSGTAASSARLHRRTKLLSWQWMWATNNASSSTTCFLKLSASLMNSRASLLMKCRLCVAWTTWILQWTILKNTYLVKNSRSWRGGLVTRVVPEVLPTFNLTTLYPVDEIQRQVAVNLAKNTNFVFEKVGIAASGDIMMMPSGKPMRTGQFKHACVEKAILHIKFQDKRAAAAIAPHAFCPVPLPLIAFGCVAIHYALEVETLPNGAARPQLDCRTYNMHYTTYIDSLRAFTVSHADESLAVQKFLWNSGCIHASIPLEAIGNDILFDESLSEEEFEWLMAANLSSGMVAAAQAAPLG